MTDPRFPFEANYDTRRDRPVRPPLRRGDAVGTIILIVAGAGVVGLAVALAIVEALLSELCDDGSCSPQAVTTAVVLTFAVPLIAWAIGTAVAVTRLRRRRRAWPVALVALLLAIGGLAGSAVWWAYESGLVVSAP